MSRYHTIFSMSVQRCQQMLMSNDYMLICNKSKPLIKARAKKAYLKFTEELQSLFGGDDQLSELIDKDVLIQSMILKKDNLIRLREALSLCYQVVDFPDKVKLLDQTKQHYRTFFHTYPNDVDSNADLETQKAQIDSVLKPIDSEIQRLGYKIKEHSPKEVEKPKEEQKQTGLTLHIAFIEQVDGRNIDRNISVYELKLKYDKAVENNKPKIKE